MMFEDQIRRLASENPIELVRLCDAGELGAVELTWAGEYLGGVDPALSVPTLARLLTHSVALAREGALIGLDKIRPASALQAIDLVAANDSSPYLRELAREIAADIRAAQ